MTFALSRRFWAHVERGMGCLLWRGSVGKGGHGRFRSSNGKLVGAHRVAWELTKGPIPPGLCVLHKCDVPACCNPEHLFLGTIADNNADRDAKGRQRAPRGAAHGRSKLRAAEVAAIRRALSRGRRQVDIAQAFGITQANVSAIKLSKTWRDQ